MYWTSTPAWKPPELFLTSLRGVERVGPGSVTVGVPIVCCLIEKIDGPANTPTSILFATGIIQIALMWTTFSVCFAPPTVALTARGWSNFMGSGMLALTATSASDDVREKLTPARRLFPHTR